MSFSTVSCLSVESYLSHYLHQKALMHSVDLVYLTSVFHKHSAYHYQGTHCIVCSCLLLLSISTSSTRIVLYLYPQDLTNDSQIAAI